MILFIVVTLIAVCLFALQDVIACRFGWYISGPEKSYYVITTLIISAIIRILL